MLFAKAPVAGSVKTRLIPPLTSTQAASLHQAFVRDMLTHFQALPGVDLELHTDTDTDAWKGISVTRKLQIFGGLELKMIHSLQGALRRGYQSAMVLGTDVPTLPVSFARDLLHSHADVALGPTEDGGFFAVSARRIAHRMFDGVSWSRRDTLEQTVRAVRAQGLTVHIGQTWFDVDEPADLARLSESPHLPLYTAQWFERNRIPDAAIRA